MTELAVPQRISTQTTPGVRTDPIDAALDELAAGRPVVVLDSPDRENEGDLIMAAEYATAAWVGFFVRHTSGYLCAPMDEARADRLELPPMVSDNEDSKKTAYTITCDARYGTSTGISAADRARTLAVLADPDAVAHDLIRPGHMVPLRARAGGVLARAGHTEAAVDLCTLAGLTPVGVIGELVHDDGSMRRAASCREFADEHHLVLVTIEALIERLSGLHVDLR